METEVTPSKTPSSCQPIVNFCATTPRRRSGRRRTQSDTYRKVALTRSASQALRIQKPMLASRSYSFRNKPLLLKLLSDSALSNKSREQENSIQKITPALDDAQTSSICNGKLPGTGRKLKANAIKLNLQKATKS